MPATPVSILLPAYNGARHLAQALDSVIAQTHGEFELLAIDDGSTDETPDILRSFARLDSRIRVLSHPNIGMGRSLNEAIELAKFDWIVRTDADDLMLRQRIERQLAFVAEHPELSVAAALVEYIDDAGRVIGRNASPYTDPARVRAARERNALIGFHHPTVIMRRDVIRAVGGYRPRFWPADDIDLWNRVAERDPLNPGLLVQPERLLRYRIHGGSVCVADARLTERRAEWVEACIAFRRAGAREPDWDTFLAEQRRRPWPTRMNGARRGLARYLYKSAAFAYSCRSYARFVPQLMGALLLEPGFVVPRLLPQVRRNAE